ncbi:hypothetical protein ACG7TL_008064 [Trametes sanguinea]
MLHVGREGGNPETLPLIEPSSPPLCAFDASASPSGLSLLPPTHPTTAEMQLNLLATLAVLLGSAVFVAAAPAHPHAARGMPLPMRLAAKSNSARAPNAGADPYALPWGVHR